MQDYQRAYPEFASLLQYLSPKKRVQKSWEPGLQAPVFADASVSLQKWLDKIPSIKQPDMQTVVVERWWQVPLSEEGCPPRLHPRRHQVYRLVEDTKHGPREKLELILTQTVPKLGGRGDVVFVKKSLGRNKLLPEGLAVYASPENRQMFEEERRKLWEGKPEERVQTRTGDLTVQYLKRCHLEVGMKNNVKCELTKEIVCRQLLRRLGVFVPPHALRLPDEPITRWGEYWCEVTVNGLETVRIPMSVVNFMKPKTRAYKNWLKKEQAESQDSNPDETGKEDS